MKTAKVEFWSDHIDFNKTIFRNLKDATMRKMAIEALKNHAGDGDVFVAKDVMGDGSFEEVRLCFVKVDGELWEEDSEGNRL
jgi:hypothetical protein